MFLGWINSYSMHISEHCFDLLFLNGELQVGFVESLHEGVQLACVSWTSLVQDAYD